MCSIILCRRKGFFLVLRVLEGLFKFVILVVLRIFWMVSLFVIFFNLLFLLDESLYSRIGNNKIVFFNYEIDLIGNK